MYNGITRTFLAGNLERTLFNLEESIFSTYLKGKSLTLKYVNIFYTHIVELSNLMVVDVYITPSSRVALRVSQGFWGGHFRQATQVVTLL